MMLEKLEGVTTDVCRAHGIWFDVDEAERLIARVRNGERVATANAVEQASREGKLSGALFGVLSLLFDPR